MISETKPPDDAAKLRQQAEAIARHQAAQSLETLNALSLEEARQTLHELQVHQIELEMQNEELRRAQAELDAARARYFDLYDLAPVGYCTLSEPGLILEANLTAATLLGVPRGALASQPISRFILPEDQDLYYRHRKQLTQAGVPQTLELRLLRKNGPPFWAQLATAPIQDADGAPGCRLVLSDITERKQAEAVLQESEDRLRLAQEGAHVGIWDWNMQTGAVSWTRELEGIYGFAGGAFPGNYEAFRARVHPEDVERMEREWNDAVKAHEAFDLDFRVCLPSGEHRWVNNKGRALYDTAGQAQRLLGVNVDITERKRAEEAVRQTQQTLTELVERSPFGTYIIDSQFRIAMMNASSQTGAFRNVRPVVGRDFSEAMRTLWPEPVAAEIIGHFRHTLDTGEPYYSPTFINPRHDAEIVEAYEWELHRMTLPDGQHGVICYYYDSTKLRTAEQALRESEQRLRLAHQGAGTGAFEWNVQTGVNIWAPELEAMYGLAPGEFGRTQPGWEQLVHPEDRAAAVGFVNKAFETGQPVEGEWRVVWRDDSVHWLAGRFQAFKDAAGKPLRLSGVNLDITQRKQAEAALRESEEQFRVLIHNLISAVALVNERGEFTIVNRAFLRLFDLDEHAGILNLKSRDWGQYRVFDEHGCLLDVDEHPVRKAILTGTAVKDVLVGMQSPGRSDLKWLLISAEPILNPQGNLHQLITTYHDITERKLAGEALQKSQQLLQDVIDGSPSPIFLKDSAGKFLTINTALEKMLGLAREELKGKTDYDIAPQAVADYWRAHDKQVVETGKAMQIEEVADLPDGHHIFLANKFPLVDATGQIYGVGAISHDITERKRAEEQLEASLREKEVMLKEIHHRVKNNLQVISSLVDLHANTLDDPVLRGLFQDVRNRVRSMALVHEKLYQSESLASVDFADYTRSLVGFLSRAHAGSKTAVRFNLDLQPVALPVETAVPCGLILNELITNAFKHAFRGRTEGEVTTALSPGPDGGVSLRVSDDGVGLPADLDWRQTRSLGLQLIHLLSGQLDATVEVRTGVGTEFLISFKQPQCAQAGEPTHA